MITISKKPMWAIEGNDGKLIEVDRETFLKILEGIARKKKKSS